jgi:hypothetical protein
MANVVHTQIASRRTVAALVSGLAAAVATVSLLLPWVKTGSTSRSAFALVGDLRRAGLLHGAAARLVTVGVVAVPFMALGALIGAGSNRATPAAALASLTGALTAATAFTVLVVARHRAAAGVTVSLVTGLVALAAGLSTVLVINTRRSPHRG